jgi:uncharacterized protein YndB with AHSA1/START domain
VKIVKVILAVVALAVLVVLGLASRQPDEFRMERRIVVAAAPEKVFPYLEDPRKTVEWSPWEKKDPGIQKTFSGAAKGKGSVYEWKGNKEVGAGRAEIVEVEPNKRVVIDLQFLAPMKARDTAEYLVTPVAGGSEVTWSFRGPMPLISKVFCLFMDMDKMVGGEFEKGLADLKTLVEKK